MNDCITVTELRAELRVSEALYEDEKSTVRGLREIACKKAQAILDLKADLAAAKLTLETFKIERELMKPIKAANTLLEEVLAGVLEWIKTEASMGLNTEDKIADSTRFTRIINRTEQAISRGKEQE